MQNGNDISILPIVKTALSNFGFPVKPVPLKFVYKNQSSQQKDDEFKHSGTDPLPPEERVEAAIRKFNGDNYLRFVAETNIFAEPDNDYNLLQEYNAYKNPELKGLELSPISKDTVFASHKRKSVEIKCKVLEDGSKEQEIKFQDGSQINYVLFAQGRKIKINEEEFEMPAGTILEEKSVKGRVFSKLIQTPDMKNKVINKPEIIDEAEEVLNKYNQSELS